LKTKTVIDEPENSAPTNSLSAGERVPMRGVK
jgi:hypothetical protein